MQLLSLAVSMRSCPLSRFTLIIAFDSEERLANSAHVAESTWVVRKLQCTLPTVSFCHSPSRVMQGLPEGATGVVTRDRRILPGWPATSRARPTVP